MKIILVIVLLLYILGIPAAAYDVPNPDQEGSIRIAMRYAGAPVSGGELTLYRVGDIKEDNGNYSFSLTEEFKPSAVSLEKLQSPETAQLLADYAKGEKTEGQTKVISTTGKIAFEVLRPGLYLLVQNKAPKGYYRVQPFLVSLPMPQKNGYTYDVDASPKVSPLPKPLPENLKQPQTGQPVWQNWLFAISAAGLLTLHLLRKRGRA